MLKIIDSHLRSRKVRRYTVEAAKIEAISNQIMGLNSGQLAANFHNLYGRHDREAMQIGFAIIIEMADRVLSMCPYRVQIMGALAMNDGHIAEMGTGEGKTLTAALPLAWHGLQGRAHAMTVNDYLAQRDAKHLEPLFEALGLTVSFLKSNMDHDTRLMAYRANVVYGTPSQFVFDYLRDHVATSLDRVLHQSRDFVLVDEADSIFIDEARTPMVLSGEGELDQDVWSDVYQFIKTLSHEEISQDRRTQIEKIVLDQLSVNSDIAVNVAEDQAFLTEPGTDKVTDFLISRGLISSESDLWQTGKSYLWRIVTACVKARHLFLNDRDYIVRDDKAIIIDKETGRLSQGRRWSDGLHQAVEAKEGITIRPESKDLGRIALSNYLALYGLVSGMTGTAMTEADEILDLYGLQVVPIPTHKPRIRKDLPDVVFMTHAAKLRHIAEDVKRINATGQPILIGTSSVEESEKLSRLFQQEKISHRVLNARQDAEEAIIVAQAGRFGAITIATSMAGRGTDILLGGNKDILDSTSPETLEALGITMPEEDERDRVISAGGLYVIGCERLDSSRLDLQLAGRSGRQGDPGTTRFYVALDDALMKNFGGEMLSSMFVRLGVDQDDGLEHPMISRAIAQAQSRKQSLYVASRKQGLKQDSVIDKPRSVFFSLRNDLLSAPWSALEKAIESNVQSSMDRMIAVYLNAGTGFEEEWDLHGFTGKFAQWGQSRARFESLYSNFTQSGFQTKAYSEKLSEWIAFDLRARLGQLTVQREDVVRQCLLLSIDRQWHIFLDESESIRNGIHLRAYAQEKPEQAFQKEIFKLFTSLFSDLPVVMLDYLFSVIMDHERMLEAKAAANEDQEDVMTKAQ